MCMAVPYEVVEAGEFHAVVSKRGARVLVSTMTLAEDVAVGDFLALVGDRHAVARYTPEQAREVIATIEEALGLTPFAEGVRLELVR